MKRSLYKVFGIAAFVAAAMCVVSCSEKEPEATVEPKFPEVVIRNDIKPGEKITLNFTPNMDWTVSIPEESFEWFKILDGKFEEQSVSGKASRLPQRIVIATASNKSFSLRSCKVSLTMGGQTKEIASYTIEAEARVLEVYPATYDENGFSFTDGGYVYENEPLTSDDAIELVWVENENMFMFPVNVKSNFEWTATWPEWARTDITADTRVGDVPVLMYGVDSKLPYDGDKDTVTFGNGKESFASFMVAIPGIREKFKANLGGYSSLTFDHAAYFRADAGTFSKDPIEGSIYGPKQCRVEVLELTESGYVKAENSWLNVSVSAWDNVAGAAVLQNRSVSVTASRYASNQDRGAMILMLPATAPENLSEIFESDMIQVKEEYAQYAIPVTQLARPEEFFTFESNLLDREMVGLYFDRSKESLLADKEFKFADGTENWQYDLTYTRSNSSTRSTVYLTEPYASVEIYDAEGNLISADLSEHWLNYDQLGDVMYGQIVMVEENLPTVQAVDEEGEPMVDEEGNPIKVKVEEIDGYVVFKNDIGEVLSIVHCFYIKEKMSEYDVYVEASKEVFVSPTSAANMGLTAYRITSGPTYLEYIEMNSPIYLITATTDDITFGIRTTKACTMYSCPADPSRGPKMVTVDNQMFFDPIIAKKIDKYLEDLAAYNEGRANGTIVDPDRVLEPKYPDTTGDRSTMGQLSFGETAQQIRTYPGTSNIRMRKPEIVKDDDTDTDTETVIPDVYKETIIFYESTPRFVFIFNLDLRGASQGE